MTVESHSLLVVVAVTTYTASAGTQVMIPDTAVKTYSGVLSCFSRGIVDHAIAPWSAVSYACWETGTELTASGVAITSGVRY